MKSEKALNEKILEVTQNIRENYPELLENLNEMPQDIPSDDDTEVNSRALTSYYESLVGLVKKYDESHTENVQKANNMSYCTVHVFLGRQMYLQNIA